MVKIRITLTILFFACVLSTGFAAQEPKILPGTREKQDPMEQKRAVEESLGRTTPQGTLFGFLKLVSKGDYDLARQYLDTRTTGISAV